MQKKKFRIVIAWIMLLTFAVSCNSAAPTLAAEPTDPSDIPVTVIVEPTSDSPGAVQSEAQVPRISVEQAKAALESGAAIIVDVRSIQAYEASHVAGALSIPLSDIETNPAGLQLEKDQWIITYCT